MGEDEWRVLEILRRRWAEVELVLKDEIRGVFPDPSVDISSRLKNFETIGEKLRRSRMRMSQMRDIVGCRIVVPGGRIRQDKASEILIKRFQNCEIKSIDRRSKPSFGYRALHLEVDIEGVVVEIQIRTQLQHEWAEAFERLADICGRGIRYGEPLEYEHLDPRLHKLLVSLHIELGKLSDLFEQYETLEHFYEARTVLQSEDLLNQARTALLERIDNVNLLLVEIRKTLG